MSSYSYRAKQHADVEWYRKSVEDLFPLVLRIENQAVIDELDRMEPGELNRRVDCFNNAKPELHNSVEAALVLRPQRLLRLRYAGRAHEAAILANLPQLSAVLENARPVLYEPVFLFHLIFLSRHRTLDLANTNLTRWSEENLGVRFTKFFRSHNEFYLRVATLEDACRLLRRGFFRAEGHYATFE